MMVRRPYIDKNGLRKGAWSAEEDVKLRDYIQRYGHWNWREIPKFAGLKRCGKSCRLRWVNYLQPNIKHGNYTKEEDDLIIKLHEELGNRWSTIAKELPGRTDNEIKNYWHTSLNKRVLKHRTNKNKRQKQSLNEKRKSQRQENSQHKIILSSINPTDNLPIQVLESSTIYPSFSQHSSKTEISTCRSKPISSVIEENSHGNANVFSDSCSDSSSAAVFYSIFKDDVMCLRNAVGELANGSFWTEPFTLENNNDDHEMQFNILEYLSSPPYESKTEISTFNSKPSSVIIDEDSHGNVNAFGDSFWGSNSTSII